MGAVPFTYTRPKHVSQQSLSSSAPRLSTDSDESAQSGCSNGIPNSLAFDRIIQGGTCPPMTARDFMNYLVYVEHAAENLQFYLWHQDYSSRFESASTSDKALAPEWTQEMHDEAVSKLRRDNVGKNRPAGPAADIFKGTDFEKQPHELIAPKSFGGGNDPFRTPPGTANSLHHSMDSTTLGPASTVGASYASEATEAFQAVGVKQPFTIQPFREEMNRVIATYIMDGAPRQLNLASWELKVAMQALSYTTHPSALRGVIKTVESSLRRQAHPNFVRWSICNGNPARVLFARCLGVGLIVAGFAIAAVVTLSDLGRGYRALAAIAWVLGISTLIAAYKGMCVVLHGMHHRHIRPWELFDQSKELSMEDGHQHLPTNRSFESFGTSNSYEDEPWVVKYQRRNVVRKVFDREVWVQEPALRQIQDVIFVQAIVGSVVAGAVLAGIFVALPGGGFF
jgi:hypothetical protein